MSNLPSVLPSPLLPENLNRSAKWLAGEGAGSWFVIDSLDDEYKFYVKRYSPEGKLECEGTFIANNKLDLKSDFQLTYPSFCNKVSLIQHNKIIKLASI